MRIHLIIIISFVFNSFYSQDFNAEWSEGFSKDKEESLMNIIETNSGYAIIRKKKDVPSSFGITMISSSQNLQYDKLIELPTDKVLAIEMVGGKIAVFAAKYNKATKENELSVYHLNGSGDLTSTSLLHKSPANGGYQAEYRISVSPDKKSVAVLCERAFVENRNEFLDILILDAEAQIVKKMEHGYSFSMLKKRVNIPVINNDGVVYIVKRLRVKAENKYYMTVLDPSGANEFPIKMRNRKIADVSFDLDKEGDLIVAGFYASYGRLNFEGAFMRKFGSKAPTNMKEFILPENSITAFKSKKEISKTGSALDNFRIRKVIATEGGKSYLVAEHLVKVKEKETVTDSRKGLLIIKFSIRGDFLWSAPINTNQIDENDKGYWSSGIFYGNDEKMNVVYNMIGQVDKKVRSEFGQNTLFAPMVNEIDLNGRVSVFPASQLFNNLSEKVSLRTQCYLHNNEELIIVAENATRDKFYVGKVQND